MAIAEAAAAASNVRGAIVIGTLDWLRQTHGAAGYEAVRDRASAEATEVLTSRILLNSSWIPASAFDNINEQIVTLFHDGDWTATQAIGAHVAMADLSSYMKVFMRVATPRFILSRFPKIWRHYFSRGELSPSPVEAKHSASFSLVGADGYGRGGCGGTMGWTEAALRKTGATAARVSHDICVFRGASHCLFKARW